jgi:hypothetical protein
MERRYRRTYAGRPGYAKREEWIAEREHVPARPGPIGPGARQKLTAYAIAQLLHKHGIPRPSDHEALLAITSTDSTRRTRKHRPRSSAHVDAGDPQDAGAAPSA